MAAHVVTALRAILYDPHREMPHIEAALTLSCWTEDLDLDDYRDLSQVENPQQLLNWAYSVQGKYVRQWENFGLPKTREEWIRLRSLKYVTRKIEEGEDVVEWEKRKEQLETELAALKRR